MEYFKFRIAKYAEEMSKLLAVKIIQTYTQLMKMQSETESQSSSSPSITVRRSVDKKWSSSVAGRVFTLSFGIPLPCNEWKRVFRSVAIVLFVFALFCFFIKSS